MFALFVSAFVNALFSGAIQDNTDVWLWGGLGLGIYARHRRAVRPRADRAWQPIAQS